MKKILFQGDSITDACRTREEFFDLGKGYPNLVSAEVGYDYPNEYEFINRGISGNRITDLLTRVKCDMINLEPDYMSILIGVNDVWHELGNKNGVCAERFECYYNMLIEEVKEALPNIKIMILGPYVLQGIATADKWDDFRSEVEKRAECAKRVAEKNNLLYMPLMEVFNEAAERVSPEYWTADGVHPTPAGHELIKREWLKGFEKLK